MDAQGFWRVKRLEAMTAEEWEAVCDGCGQCCLVRLIDQDTGRLYRTDVACTLLDLETVTCGDYPNRTARVPACVRLTPQTVPDFPWLPETCGYRRLAEGKELPPWHHLVCGDRDAVHRIGPGVRGRVVSERDVDPDDLVGHVVAEENTARPPRRRLRLKRRTPRTG